MSRSEKRSNPSYTDRVQSLVRHIQKQNVYFSASSCVFHFNKPCLTLLNNFDADRFHCLYASHAIRWRYYSLTRSCDIPEHFYDMIVLNKLLGDEYVLPFAGHFRESSGYTIGMFRQTVELYPPRKIEPIHFAEAVFATIVLYVAVCHRLGGNSPNIKACSFLYTSRHPVLCDVGSANVEHRERLHQGDEHFNQKKWRRFLNRKTNRSIVQYLKVYFPHYFQKKKRGKRCILNERDVTFSDETHRLVCRSEKSSLSSLLRDFGHLIPDRRLVLQEWISSIEEEEVDANPIADPFGEASRNVE